MDGPQCLRQFLCRAFGAAALTYLGWLLLLWMGSSPTQPENPYARPTLSSPSSWPSKSLWDWLPQQHFLLPALPQQPQPSQWRQTLAHQDIDIPLYDHPLIDAYINYFTGRGKPAFARWLQRAERYSPILKEILAEHGLPQDLIYLAMIESGFNSQARSKAKAVGVWQLMGPTGRLLGLHHSVWVDERRDFVLATHAAARYLKALLVFTHNDWHLAWACYNAGIGRIQRALHTHEVKDYWALAQIPGSLSSETRHYVPKVIAATLVAHNAARFGFKKTAVEQLLPEEKAVFARFMAVQVPPRTHLLTLATSIGATFSQLRELNPSLLKQETPPLRPTIIRIPAHLWTRKTQKAIAVATARHTPKKYTVVAKAPLLRHNANKQISQNGK